MTDKIKIDAAVPTELRGIVKITYLNKDNCTLTEKNGFLGIRATLDDDEDEGLVPEQDTEQNAGSGTAENSGETSGEKTKEIVAERIFLSRAFPFDMPYEYISVLDKDKKEIAFIRSLEDFAEPERSRLLHELEAKYYTPVIKRIISVKERYGFSFWKTECEFGEKSFTLQDTFRSIVKSPSNDGGLRIYILDIDGNRYEIPDVEALDRLSYKKIELYL